MLSILIPVYNFDILPLVKKLDEQLKKVDFLYEIICLDDASSNMKIQKGNLRVTNYKNFIYEINNLNLGRSKSRNLLVEKAKYNKLIFLDCDVIPVNIDFIKNYYNSLNESHVVFGGLKYPELNENLKASLHYKYGFFREVKSYSLRKNRFGNNFSTASFAINKDVLEEVRFDESITTYGFEDLVFVKELIKKDYEILQIDNPVIHLGIQNDNSEFISKEQESLGTLMRLYKKGILKKEDVVLLKSYLRIKALGLTSFYNFFYKRFKTLLLKNLKSENPSLFFFDLYRLGYFTNLKG